MKKGSIVTIVLKRSYYPGEGNFSFSACLARALGSANNIVATSYHDEDLQVIKHSTSIPYLEELKMLGCLLVFEVDVNKMHTHPVLKKMKFDVIIYNFPHAGHYYINETSLWLIEMHRELVGAYFKSASKMLNEGGEVHLRHRDNPPYDKWNVISLAGGAGLKLKDKVSFHITDYPGYSNIRGGNVRSNGTFPISCAYTFKFSLDLLEIDRDDMKNNEVNDDGFEKKDHDVLVIDKDQDTHMMNPKKYDFLNQFVTHVLDQMKDHEHASDASKKDDEDHDEQNLVKKAETTDENEISRIGLSNSVSKTEVSELDARVVEMNIYNQEQSNGEVDLDDVHEHEHENETVNDEDNDLLKKDAVCLDLALYVPVLELNDPVKDEHIKTDKDVGVVHELKGLSLHDIIDQDQDDHNEVADNGKMHDHHIEAQKDGSEDNDGCCCCCINIELFEKLCKKNRDEGDWYDVACALVIIVNVVDLALDLHLDPEAHNYVDGLLQLCKRKQSVDNLFICSYMGMVSFGSKSLFIEYLQ
ncbi:hypothetical protein Tco_1198971, partial [Tanacetum coccineum]